MGRSNKIKVVGLAGIAGRHPKFCSSIHLCWAKCQPITWRPACERREGPAERNGCAASSEILVLQIEGDTRRGGISGFPKPGSVPMLRC